MGVKGQSAGRDATQAVRRNPTMGSAHLEVGRSLDRAGKFAEALNEFARAIQLSPADAQSYLARADASLRKGERAQAIADFTQAICFDPRLTAAYNNRGSAYLSSSERDAAIADFTSHLRSIPARRGVATTGPRLLLPNINPNERVPITLAQSNSILTWPRAQYPDSLQCKRVGCSSRFGRNLLSK